MPPPPRIITIITGGQTGVDTAAIDAALALSLPYRGWVPHGFTNEDGLIPSEHRPYLHETPSTDNAQRTEWNVRDADAVLTLLRGPPEKAIRGTKVGVDVAGEAGKRMCFVDLMGEWLEEVRKVRGWLGEVGSGSSGSDAAFSVAVGGPRESEEPGIREESERFLLEAFGDL